MKHLKTFNEQMVNQLYAVGDTVKFLWAEDGQEHIGKIVKINSKNSYIVNIQQNNRWINEPIAINNENILDITSSVGDPAQMNDYTKFKMTKVSNDLVINNYPGGSSNASDYGYTSGPSGPSNP